MQRGRDERVRSRAFYEMLDRRNSRKIHGSDCCYTMLLVVLLFVILLFSIREDMHLQKESRFDQIFSECADDTLMVLCGFVGMLFRCCIAGEPGYVRNYTRAAPFMGMLLFGTLCPLISHVKNWLAKVTRPMLQNLKES